MEQKTIFKRLESELEKLSFNKVIEITNLTKGEADELHNLYNQKYIVRGPCQEGSSKYILSFELNPYKKTQNEAKNREFLVYSPATLSEIGTFLVNSPLVKSRIKER